MFIVRQSTARTVTVGPILDADGVAVTTAVVGDLKISKNGAAPAALNASATLTHRHTGHYSLALTATDLNTVGTAEVVIDATTNAMAPKELMVIEEAVYDVYFASAASGLIPGIQGTIQTLDALDTAQDTQHATTQGKVDTAQADLDLLTGTDGATLATSQPNYAPAVAGDQMNLANDAITAAKIAADAIGASELAADAITEIQTGLATAAELAKVPKSDGTATWNATAAAQIQSEATDALNAYDPPTKAEMDTGHAAIEADTQDIQSRLPAALVSGRMDSVLGNAAHGGTAATITAERIVVASTTTNQPAIKATGNGTAAGIQASGGSGGPGITASAGVSGTHGILASGAGSGDGIRAMGGTAGNGIYAEGGGTGGAGMQLVGGGASNSLETPNMADFEARIQGADGDTLKVLSDQIDGIATGSAPHLLVTTTIATLASQTVFTLTAGSADDDAYNDAMVIVTDSATSTQKCVGTISDYDGGTRQVTLYAEPGIFTMAPGDAVSILANDEWLHDQAELIKAKTDLITSGGITTVFGLPPLAGPTVIFQTGNDYNATTGLFPDFNEAGFPTFPPTRTYYKITNPSGTIVYGPVAVTVVDLGAGLQRIYHYLQKEDVAKIPVGTNSDYEYYAEYSVADDIRTIRKGKVGRQP